MEFNFYNLLKKYYTPKTCLDVGAHRGDWSSNIKNIFPNSYIICMDANWYVDQIPGSNITFIETLYKEDDVDIKFYRSNHNRSTGAGDSVYKENTFVYNDDNLIVETRKTKKISTLLKTINSPKIDVLKLDVQATEIEIMDGMDEFINDVDFIQIECSLSNYNLGGCTIEDVILYLKNKNFEVFEITESVRNIDGFMTHIDLIFQNKKNKIIDKKLMF
jgi:FkbM family methyltransferase